MTATENREGRLGFSWSLRLLVIVIIGLLAFTAFQYGKLAAYNDNSAPNVAVSSFQNEDGGWNISFIIWDWEDADNLLSLDVQMDARSGTAKYVETTTDALGSRVDVYEVSSGAIFRFKVFDSDGGKTLVSMAISEGRLFFSSTESG